MSEQDTGLQHNRRHRRWVWLAAGVLVVVAAIGWWWMRALANATFAPATAPVATPSLVAEPVDSNRTAVANRGTRLIEAGSTSRHDNQRKPFLLEKFAPVTDAVKVLLPLAEAGDAGAMYELGFRLSLCQNHLDSDEASVRRNALREFYAANGHEPKSDDELSNIASSIDAGTAMLGMCRGLDPKLMATGVNWVERAARGGDIGALLWYADGALDDMHGTDDILMNLDEVARRRQLAGRFLHTALDRGACDALSTLSAAYSGGHNSLGWLFKADPYLSLVYSEAAFRAGIVTSVWSGALAGVNDPARRAAAAAQGAELAAQRCGR